MNLPSIVKQKTVDYAIEIEQMANELDMEVLGVKILSYPESIRLRFHALGEFTLVIKKFKDKWMFMHLGNCIASDPRKALLRMKAKIKTCS